MAGSHSEINDLQACYKNQNARAATDAVAVVSLRIQTGVKRYLQLSWNAGAQHCDRFTHMYV
jgi:hypothetical protein